MVVVGGIFFGGVFHGHVDFLGDGNGGLKYFFEKFHPLGGFMIQFDEHIFFKGVGSTTT